MSVSTVDAWYQQEVQVPQAASVKFTAFNGNEYIHSDFETRADAPHQGNPG